MSLLLSRAVVALRARAPHGPLARLADRLEAGAQDSVGALRVAVANDAGDAAIDALCALRLGMADLDPSVVASVASRVLANLGRCPEGVDHRLRDDVLAFVRFAPEAVERRGPVTSGPFRGQDRRLPQWWRAEYRDDPILGALAQMGAPAGLALVQVVAAGVVRV